MFVAVNDYLLPAFATVASRSNKKRRELNLAASQMSVRTRSSIVIPMRGARWWFGNSTSQLCPALGDDQRSEEVVYDRQLRTIRKEAVYSFHSVLPPGAPSHQGVFD